MNNLSKILRDGCVSIEPMTDFHIESLRLACAQDTEIWDIYPLSFLGEYFDASLNIFLSNEDWVNFAISQDNIVVGMSNYIRPDIDSKTVEIGGTYITPSVRGTGLNDTMKNLMISHAFDCGFDIVGFRVDRRNTRSAAAVKKLGAKQKEILFKNMTTWTGHVRDTLVFELTQKEWLR